MRLPGRTPTRAVWSVPVAPVVTSTSGLGRRQTCSCVTCGTLGELPGSGTQAIGAYFRTIPNCQLSPHSFLLLPHHLMGSGVISRLE